MKPNFKRLSIDIEEHLHHNIKVWSAQRGLTMKEFLLFSVTSQIAKDKMNKEYEDRDEK